MSTKISRSVSDPNAKGGSSFLWVIVALLVVAALVIGLIVWQSQGQKTSYLAERDNTEVTFDLTYDADNHQITASTSEDGTEVEIFEDFSCVHCANLHINTEEQMLAAVEAGDIVVNIKPMHFLDNGSEGHSTLAMAATLALADHGEWNAYWNLREVLMEEQQGVVNQWSADDMANAAAELGASEEAVDAIRNNDYLEEAKEWGQANAEYMADNTGGEVATPRVFVEGEDLPNQDLQQWVEIASAA